MSFNVLSPQVSVSGQIQASDLSKLKEFGVEIVICNRPDNEDHPQPLFSEIADEALSLGLETYNIPFSGGEMTQAQVDEFKAILDSGKKIHAYCRSGNRSSIIWQAATQA